MKWLASIGIYRVLPRSLLAYLTVAIVIFGVRLMVENHGRSRFLKSRFILVFWLFLATTHP
jgi:hypothetical protein